MNRKSAKEQVEILVEYFAKNIHQIKTPNFNEAQTRQLLIDPFFEALGWDVRNKSMEPPYRLEVIPEGRVKTMLKNNSRHDEDIQYIIEDEFKADHKLATKKPDYRFRIQGQTKFFVEAKKPYVDLSTNLDAIFQIKRYGFSARVPISILTDFDQFRVFDCTRKPFYDKPKTGVLKEYDLTYDSYLDKFDNLYDTFSRDAILAGSLEILQKKYFEKRTGEFSLDRAFLDDLSQWRVELAQDIAKHPKNRRILNNFLLNECVQRILDRIVFLRVCEDRTIEETGTLLALLRLWQDHPAISLYHKFNELIKNRRSLYNGLLFAEHESEQLEVGNKVLENIFKNINYPLSPYNFDEIGVEILGSIYERFLGRTIRMTEKQVRIEEKPEVRKAGGVYYTPQYIVKYIVENTLGKLLYADSTPSLSPPHERGDVRRTEGVKKLKLSPKQIEKIKIIDIACGSGSFLLGALQMLFDYHVQWYTEHPADVKEKHGVRDAYIDATGLMQISSRKKREILVNNIYGVDIDPQAVEVTQMSLYLKVLEDENDATLNKPTMLALHEVLLPPLKNNIKCGNSLIGTDIFSQGDLFDNELIRKINPFDWETEFPGIFAPSHLQGEARGGVGSPSTGSGGGFDCVIGNPPYIQMSMNEYFNDSVSKYLLGNFCSSMGRLNSFGFFIEQAVRLLKLSGRLGYIIPNTILTQPYYEKLRGLILSKSRINNITTLEKMAFEEAVVETVILTLSKDNDTKQMLKNSVQIDRLSPNGEAKVLNKVRQELFTITFKSSFNLNLESHLIAFQQKLDKNSNKISDLVNVNQAIALKYDRAASIFKKKNNEKYKPLLDGRDINKYSLNFPGNFLLYDLKKIHSCKREDIFLESEKLLFRRVGDRLTATYDNSQYYALNTLVVITRKESLKPSLKYILALFNSKLLNFYYMKFFKSNKKVFSEIQARQVAQLPIRTIDFINPDEKQIHDELVGLVDRMLELNKQIQKIQSDSERETVKRLITATDNKIDQLVYKLYELTEEEIKIVEGG